MIKDYTNCQPQKVLKEVFGFDSFRLLQKEIISNVLSHKDTLAIMPTGGGKSLCYQIPALIFDGLTVVVSPLISLMQDQVSSLNAAGVNAVFLNSTVEWENYLESMNSIRRGETKILYVSPEGLVSSKITELLHDTRVKLRCITIDEAHCVSEWGHDFRPEFLEIASIRRQFPSAVCLALTATATAQVQKDVVKNLALQDPDILVSSFDRPNIFLSVKSKNNPLRQVVECIRSHWDESGIIYCFSRKQVDELTKRLLELGYSALNYHAGLSDEERRKNQNLFIRDQVQIMVATLAFGMGIDKPNVRFIIHYDLPKSLEQYYQEIGRAGRDGLSSEALLLYSPGDLYKIRHFFTDSSDPVKGEKLLQSMADYAESTVCRRKILLSYFGEQLKDKSKKDTQNCCDICRLVGAEEVDMTIPTQKLMSCIIRTESRFGASYVIDVLSGSRSKRILENSHDKLSTWGIGRELDKNQWNTLVQLLIAKNFLSKTDDFGVLKLTEKGLEVLKNRDKIFVPSADCFSKKERISSDYLKSAGQFIPKNPASTLSGGGLLFPKPERKNKKYHLRADFSSSYGSFTASSADNIPDNELIRALKKWRKRKAEEMNVPPYVIFGDKTLFSLIEKKPRTNAELLDCYGIGENKMQSFGAELLELFSRLD